MGKKLTQNIAVFGESGSGKTVLLSSFYGALQEPHAIKKNHFYLSADNASQGNILGQNFLGMKKSAHLPSATRFQSTSYGFTLKRTTTASEKTKSNRPSELGLVWHDYPGEWFEQDVSGPEEAQRRVDTFRELLGSDVALVLVDSQRLIDNAGHEQRYLKSLLTNFRNGLLALQNDILHNGEPLVEFPRIWMFALSKSDLLPEWDVNTFKEILIEKVGQEIVEFRKVVSQFVVSEDALSVGEDYLLLSSAKFEPNKIEVEERVGVNLILPIASVLPFERQLKWAQAKNVSRKLALQFVIGAGAVAAAIAGKSAPKLGAKVLVLGVAIQAIKSAIDFAGKVLAQSNADAERRNDFVSMILTQFKKKLDESEDQKILLQSIR